MVQAIRGTDVETGPPSTFRETNAAARVSKVLPLERRKRYCGNRFTKCQYVTLWVFIAMQILITILSLVGYFVIVPNVIKKTFAEAEIGGGDKVPTLQDLNVKKFSETGVDVSVAASLSNTKLAVSFFSGGLDPTTFNVNDADSGQSLLSLTLSNALTLDGKSDLQIQQDTVSINFPDPTKAKDAISTILSAIQSGSNASLPLNLVITAKASFTLVGIKFNDIALERFQPIDLAMFAQMASRLLGGLAGPGLANGTSPVSARITPGPSPSSVTISATTRLARRQEATNSTSVSATLALGSLAVEVNQDVISVAAGGTFTATQPITVALGPVSFSTVLASQDIARITVSGLSLSKAANTFNIKIDILPMIGSDSESLKQIVQRLASGASADGIPVGVRNFTIANVDGKDIPWLNTVLSAVNINADLGAVQKQLAAVSGASGAQPSEPSAPSSSALMNILNIKGIDVQLQPNSTILINPSVTIKSPFDAQIKVAAITGSISANSATQLVSFQLPAIEIKGTQEQNLNLPIQLVFASSAEAQVAVSQLTNKVLAKDVAVLQLGQIKIGGQQQTGLNNLASIVSIPIPLDGALLYGDSKPATGVTPAPASTGSLIKDFILNNASFALSETGFNAGVKARFSQSLPISIQVPYVAIRMGVDDRDLVGLNVNGIGLSQGPQALSLSADGTIATDPAVGDKLTSIANQLKNATPDPSASKLIFQGFEFGASRAEAFTLFKAMNATIPVALLQSLSQSGVSGAGGIYGTGDISGAFTNPSLSSAKIDATAEGIAVAAGANVNVSLPVTVSAPFLGFDILNEDNRIVSVSVGGVAFQPGANDLKLVLGTKFATGQQAEQSAASLAQTVLGGNLANAKIAVSGLKFGVDEAKAIGTFSSLKISIPASLLAGGSGTSTGGLDLTKLFPNAALNDINPQIQSVNVSTQNNGISVAPSVSLSNPLPVSLSVPFVAVTVTVNNATLMSSTLQGLTLVPGPNAINALLANTFGSDPTLPESVKQLFDKVSAGQLSALGISVTGIRFGLSAEQSVGALSSVAVPIPLDTLLTAGGNATSGLNLATLFPGAVISLDTLKPQIRALNVAAAEKGLIIAPSVNVNNPLPVSASMPFIGLTVSVGDTQLTSAALSGLQITSGQNALDLSLANTFGTDAALPANIKQLFDDVSAGRAVESISVGGLRFGPNEAESVSALSGINIKVPLNFLAGGGSAAPSGLSLATLFPNASLSLNDINPQIQLVNITAVANGIDIAPAVSLTNTLPISLSIPFIAFSTSINNNQFISSKLSGLGLASGQNNINAVLANQFGTDAALPGSVKQLVDSVVAGQFSQLGLSVTGITFGVSEASSINLFSAINAPIPVDQILGGQQTSNTTTRSSDITKLFPAFGNLTLSSFAPVLRKADLASTADGFNLDINAGLTNPIPVSVNIGFVSTDIALAQSKLAAVSISNLALGTGQTELAPSVNMVLGRDAALAAEISSIFTTAQNGGVANIGVGALTFGPDAQNAVTTFSQISIPLALPLAGLLSAGNAGGAASAAAIPIALGKIEGADFATTDTGIRLGAQATVVNSSPLSFRMGFISVGLSSPDGAKLAQVSLSNLTLGTGSALSSLQLNAALENGQAASQGAATLFNSVLQSQPSAVRVSNILFGDSEAGAFDFLKTVDQAIPIPAGAVAAGGAAGNTTAPGPSAIPAILLVNTDFATTADGVSATVTAGLGATAFPIKIDLGFASAGVLLDQTNLAKFSTQGIRVGDGNNVVVPIYLAMLPMDPAVPTLVGNIVNPILAGGAPREFAVGANQIFFGASPEKTFDILSGINFSMPVPASLIASVLSSAGGAAGGAGAGIALPTLVDPKIATTATGFAASLAANFAQPLPLSANIGFAGVDISLDDTRVSAVGIGKTTLDKAGSLSTSTDIQLESGSAAQDKVAALVNPLVASLLSANKTQAAISGNVKVSGLVFGGEGAAANPLLSQVAFLMPLAQIANLATAGNTTAPAADPGALPLNAAASFVVVPTGVQGQIAVPPSAAVPLTIDIGNLNAKIGMTGINFGDLAVSKIQLAPTAAGNLDVNLLFAVNPNVYPTLVEKFLGPGVTVDITEVTFGQPNSPLTLFSGVKAPLLLQRGGLPTPKLDLIPPSATFAFESTMPLTLEIGTLSLDGMLGNSKAATIEVAQASLKKGQNEIKAGIDLNLLGGITGLPQLLLGGSIAGANVKLTSNSGQDITWITQSFVGKRVAIDLAALTGGAPNAAAFAAGQPTPNDSQFLLQTFDWSDAARSALVSSASVVRELLPIEIVDIA
ncbi:hypothetical protein DFJ77DRAFT_188322 [Powellomyces hirtus]|nr:hypothetical protein DFJ77DRAFT_188322 [Powellomyces hirtus]